MSRVFSWVGKCQCLGRIHAGVYRVWRGDRGIWAESSEAKEAWWTERQTSSVRSMWEVWGTGGQLQQEPYPLKCTKNWCATTYNVIVRTLWGWQSHEIRTSSIMLNSFYFYNICVPLFYVHISIEKHWHATVIKPNWIWGCASILEGGQYEINIGSLW